MEKLAKTLKRAAQLREDSWVSDELFYQVSLLDACDKAADEMGYDKKDVKPIYLLLEYGWDGALEWARKRLKMNVD